MEAVAVTQGPAHHSFGYYDKCPWDSTGNYMLALQAGFCDRPPGAEDVATLGTIDLRDGRRFCPFAETRAWNWQQGCMLQWLPDARSLVIYNDRRSNRFVSVICNALTGGEVRQLPLPVYAVSSDGRHALSLNFARLHRERPGYGYAGIPDPWSSVGRTGHDGIYSMDLRTGDYRLIVSLADAADLAPKPSMEGDGNEVSLERGAKGT